jgi:short-subunit dehydrogenase
MTYPGEQPSGTSPETAGSAETEVVAILGAGPGVGLSVARCFSEHGFAVGLVARNELRLQEMAGTLARTGVRVAIATGDLADPRQVEGALASIGAQLGEPSVLCFSPIPDVGLIKPVLDTRPEELMASLQLNIAGAASAVAAVLPAMMGRGRGSLLFTSGSAGLDPSPERAASAVTTTAFTTYVSLLHQALTGHGIGVGHTVIVGPIGLEPHAHHPDTVAKDLWGHHQDPSTPLRSVVRR